MTEDRSITVRPDQTVAVDWIDIDRCVLGCRASMSPEAVEKKWRALLQQGDCAAWPPIVGHWEGDRFVVCDGRHEFVASLMHGRREVLACWLVDRRESP